MGVTNNKQEQDKEKTVACMILKQMEKEKDGTNYLQEEGAKEVNIEQLEKGQCLTTTVETYLVSKDSKGAYRETSQGKKPISAEKINKHKDYVKKYGRTNKEKGQEI